MNLLSPAIGDPISVPTQDMLIGLYVLTIGNPRGIAANMYNLSNCESDENSPLDNTHSLSAYEREGILFFGSSYDALGAYRRKRIHLDSPLWLRWRLDQHVIIGSREIPLEV